ncbi:MAG: hypothetical protein WC554_15750 [Clostridia bacterium]
MPYNAVWTTEIIQQNVDKLRFGMGAQANLDCFHLRDIELKAGNITFKLSAEEVIEFNKCAADIVYFVEKYCRFMTDKGRSTIKLREYQKRILRALSEEHYIELLQDYGPKNRNIIVMSSRQSGKCLFGSEIIIKIEGTEIKIPINLLYYFKKEYLTLLEKIKVRLMLFYYKIDNL